VCQLPIEEAFGVNARMPHQCGGALTSKVASMAW